MSKAIQGAAMIGGAIALEVGAFALAVGTAGAGSALFFNPLFQHAMAALALGGISMEAGAIASALTSNRGMNITTRQAAAFRQVIYGEQRVGGVTIYESTTGSHHDQYNYVIVLAGHTCDSIVNLYLDGRQVFWTGSGTGNTTRNNVNFGGNADGNNHTGPGGQQYNFGGLVYCEPCFGDQIDAPNTTPNGGYNTGLHANDATWGPDSHGHVPWVAGCCYVYLKVEYNTAQFPNAPEVRFTVRGKNDIWDPRTSTRSYSNNWALCVADVYTSPLFQVNEAVNQAQLIAAANVCDEAVDLAIGGTEPRYCLNYHFDTSVAAGDVLQTMLGAAAGTVTRIGGEQHIRPAYWSGPSFAFDSGSLCAGFVWNPKRHPRDLYNRVAGTYIAPNYPYNATGAHGSNLYDANGFYNGSIANNFNFAFQPTSYPQYAEDAGHGYPADQYLNEDSGVQGAWSSTVTYSAGDVYTYGSVIFKSLTDANLNNIPTGGPADAYWEFGAVTLPMELGQQCVLSVTQAQRLAKIALKRNRYQGSGTFNMFPVAYRMIPTDVMSFTMPQMGWAGKTLEIGPMKLMFGPGANGVPTFVVQCEVHETGSDSYEWSTAEEQTVYAIAASAPKASYIPLAPTNLAATSLPLIGLDGVVTPRVELTWDEPLDGLVQQIEIQYQAAPVGGTAGPWIPAGIVSVQVTSALVTGLVSGGTYNYRIRSLRANGAASAWLELAGNVVGTSLSQLTQAGVGIGSLVGEAHTDGTAAIDCNPFTAAYGGLNVPILPAGFYSIGSLNQGQLYYVYYVDATFAGGAVTPIATQNPADYLGKYGYFLIDSIVTPTSSSGGTAARYYPTVWHDVGTRTTTTPDAAFDGDLSTYAGFTAACTGTGTNSTAGDLILSGFPAIALPAASTFTLSLSTVSVSEGSSATASVNVNGTTTTIDLTAGPLTVNVPAHTSLSTVTVEFTATAIPDTTSSPPDHFAGRVRVNIAEIYIQP